MRLFFLFRLAAQSPCCSSSYCFTLPAATPLLLTLAVQLSCSSSCCFTLPAESCCYATLAYSGHAASLLFFLLLRPPCRILLPRHSCLLWPCSFPALLPTASPSLRYHLTLLLLHSCSIANVAFLLLRPCSLRLRCRFSVNLTAVPHFLLKACSNHALSLLLHFCSLTLP